jgi:hypothetical protein
VAQIAEEVHRYLIAVGTEMRRKKVHTPVRRIVCDAAAEINFPRRRVFAERKFSGIRYLLEVYGSAE